MIDSIKNKSPGFVTRVQEDLNLDNEFTPLHLRSNKGIIEFWAIYRKQKAVYS